MKNNSFGIAVFASGTGTTLQTLIDRQSEMGCRIVLVVTNRDCPSVLRAEQHGIPCITTKDWLVIEEALGRYDVKLVVLAGYLAIVPEAFCHRWESKIINIHPSLLPKFGGKGMYGVHVQEAVLAAGEKEAGCSVHYVSAEVDGGEVLGQARVPVLTNDTPESLAARVQIEEKRLLPKVIAELVKKN